MRRILLTLTLTLVMVLSLSLSQELWAQCAMCRATVENNVSNGVMNEDGMGLNGGILYLLVMPYLLVATVAFFWYQNSKKNRATKQLKVEQYLNG